MAENAHSEQRTSSATSRGRRGRAAGAHGVAADGGPVSGATEGGSEPVAP